VRVEIITPDGTWTPHKWATKPGDGRARLQEMYRIIGPKCHTVEHITPKGGGHLWMDEDGKYHDLDYNEVATEIFWMDEDGKYHDLDYNEVATEIFWLAGGMPSDFIVGTIILETPERNARKR
jgi:hypothetical protein